MEGWIDWWKYNCIYSTCLKVCNLHYKFNLVSTRLVCTRTNWHFPGIMWSTKYNQGRDNQVGLVMFDVKGGTVQYEAKTDFIYLWLFTCSVLKSIKCQIKTFLIQFCSFFPSFYIVFPWVEVSLNSAIIKRLYYL